MDKKELMMEMACKGIDYDTRAAVVDDLLEIFNRNLKRKEESFKKQASILHKALDLMEDYVNNCEKKGYGLKCNFVVDKNDFISQAREIK